MSVSRALKTLSVATLARRGLVLWSAPSPGSLVFHSVFGRDGSVLPLERSLKVALDDVSPGDGAVLRRWISDGCQETMALPHCAAMGALLPVFLRRLPIGSGIHGTAEVDRGAAFDFGEEGFRQILVARLAEAARIGCPMTLGVVTIRGFDFVRDGAGHAVAQVVMGDLQDRLAACFGPSFDICIFQSDVIAFIGEAGGSADTPTDQVRRTLASAFGAPFEIDSMTYRLSANAGIAVFPDDCDSVDDLLRAAEIALERAKRSVPDAVVRCEPMWLEDAKGSLLRAVDIYTGMTTNSYIPFLQPIIDLQTGAVAGAEVLARWRHATEGLLPPDTFIPIAERHGLITDLTISLLRNLGRLVHENGLPPHRLSINLSASDLTPGSLRRILNAIDNEALLPPDRLTFEITETTLAAEPDVARSLLEMVRQRGTKVAIDDFGVGYSCFGSLGSLPVDYLKIDKSFIDGVDERAERRRLVSAICAMSAEFGLQTVAEGVETDEVATVLRGLGGRYGQGYLYARPMPFDCYCSWLMDQTISDGIV